MCTGSVDPAYIIRAFSNGTDGVFIGGCWPGECHYPTEGNYHALSMTLLIRKLLEHIGLNPRRLRIEWMSASEGIRFAEVTNDVATKVQELGPLGRGEGIDGDTLKFHLKAIQNLLPYLKLAERERMSVRFKTEEEYDEFFKSEEGDRLFRELILDKLAISQMMLLLREKPLSAGEISEKLSLDPSEVTKHLHRSVKQGFVKFDESLKRFAPA
jgi:F420-non-reducing hydrogenase iron-sulfur subunit